MALRRIRATETFESNVKPNSAQWTTQPPRTVAEALDLSDRIEESVREWTAR